MYLRVYEVFGTTDGLKLKDDLTETLNLYGLAIDNDNKDLINRFSNPLIICKIKLFC